MQENIKRTVNRKNNKWTQFIARLIEAEEEGIIGIDINASLFRIVIATLKEDGNLESYQKISLHQLINKTENQREYISWQIAHKIVETAIIQSKTIAIEILKNLLKERRGDGNKKLLQDRDFRECAMNKSEEEKQKTKEILQKETNRYKQKPLKQKIKQLNRNIKLLESLSSEPQAQELIDRRKEQVRSWCYTSNKLWLAIKVILTIPVLGKSLPRDLFPVKPVLVERE